MNSRYPHRGYGLELHVVEQGKRPHDCNRSAEIAEIGADIIFDPSILDTYHYNGWKPVHHDLLVVCAAVAFADRRCARRRTQWSRPLHISIPVQELTVWQRADVRTYLHDTLRHLTGDDWQLSFIQASGESVDRMRQRALPFNNNKEFVIAYSDGLDSRCVSGIFDTNDTAVRVRVSKTKDRIKKGEMPFDLVPFRIKPKPSPESSYRSRGFIFASITAIAGQLSGVNRIIVPESGQGALGPALLPLHNVYADYRCHPTFFRKTERFIKALLEYTVDYDQPRLWNTKGETISAFLEQSGKKEVESVANTRSCWQQRWNARIDGKLRQCGLCASCLLRRMSMHAAGVEEPVDAYTFWDLTKTRYEDARPRNNHTGQSNTMLEYGSVGVRHLQQLANMAEQAGADMRLHVFQIALAIGASEHDTNENLRKLLIQHAKEWRDFVSAQGKYSFIHRWAAGGRYG